MRKNLLSILILVFVAFSINAQIITNGGFEDWTGANPAGWGGSKSQLSSTLITVTKITTGAHGGTNACGLKNNNTSAHKRFTTTATNITEGTDYVLTFWVKGTGQIRTSIFTGNLDGGSFGYLDYGAYISVTSDWTQITRTLTADTTNSNAEFIIDLGSSADIVIDDVEVTGGTLSNQANITSFTIPEQFANATIDTTAKTVTLEVINGTSLTALVPTITTSGGATISPASGISQDFTNAVTYTVTAQDGTTSKIWTATVTASSALSSAAEITGFSLSEQVSSPTINSTNGTIAVTVGTGTSLTALTPTITLSAAASVSPASGAVQDFTNPVTYIVTAQNGTTTKNWSVTVSILQTTPIYDIQYTADPSGNSPVMNTTVTTSGIVSAVVPTKGYYLQDGDGAWKGIYVYDPTNAATASVGDNVTITGTVVEFNGMTEFSPVNSYIKNSSGNAINPTVVSTGDAATKEDYEGCFIKVEYANCTSANSGGTWKVNDGSGLLFIYKGIYDYTSAVVGTLYDVTGVMTYYSISSIFELLPRQASDVSVAVLNTEANIVSFSLAEQTGAAVINTVANTVNLEVYTGTSLTALVPTITLSTGATISPLSGVAQDFTSAIQYTVTAQNTSFTKIWTVTVTVATNTQSNQAEILTFAFPSDKQAGTSVINSTAGTVTINVFPDVDRTSLIPTITTSVLSQGVAPASGVAQNFTNPVTYTVTAQDGTTKIWTVTVTNQTITPIYDIQYTTDVSGNSPKNNQIVTVKGIVTAAHDNLDYYIQDASGAWNGINVIQDNAGFSIGDSVFVTGLVFENFKYTAIKNVTSSKLLSTLKDFSTTYLTIAEADSEAYEGVLVTIFAAKCYRTPKYGDWSLYNGKDSILVEDVIYSESDVVEVGKYYQITGVQMFSYNIYSIYPRGASDIVFVEGIEDLNNKNDIQIYPNPATNKLNVKIEVDVQSITLYNILGAKVMKVNPENSGLIELDLSSLEKGIYLMNIQTDKFSQTVKFVKQ
ncbi:MAG: hypothetical protein A2046_00225 [Bacteroidetes bacterium GWA2_30_7]|nr:MAG: hypothetical protein A2046_00225 [Bacteroidetes bacterium GWA2_30_7]